MIDNQTFLKQYPVCHIARLVLECQTPMSIKADDADPTFDTRLMRDANGLPTIPGTSLAGVMRHLSQKLYGESCAENVFGFAKQTQQQTQTQKSRLEVSFGFVHDSQNQPVQGLIYPDQINKDKILSALKQAQPIVRDQVRLNHRGVVDGAGKMDRTLIPKGTRFSVELVYWSNQQEHENDQSSWHQLLGLFKRPDFRIGGLTRRGLGAIKAHSIHQSVYALTDAADRSDFLTLNRDIADRGGFKDITQQVKSNYAGLTSLTLDLKAEDFWRVGQGATPIEKYTKAPDMLPKTEWRIEYQNQTANLKRDKDAVVIPASSIKGALSHRMAYHYNCLAGLFIDQHQAQDVTGENNQAVNLLLGAAKNNNHTAHAGYVYLDDIYLPKPPKAQQMMHNAIDRFTGGTIDGALYAEELLWETEFSLNITIDLIGLNQAAAAQNLTDQQQQWIKQAFQNAISDLAQGQLAIGAGSNRGHGYFNLTNPDTLKKLPDLFSQTQGNAA